MVLASRTHWEFYKLVQGVGLSAWFLGNGIRSWSHYEMICHFHAFHFHLWLQMMHIEMQTPKMIPCHETVAEHNCARLRCGKVCLLPLEHWDCGSKIAALIVTYSFISMICSVPPLCPLASFCTVLFIVLPQLTISFSCMLIAVNHRILWIDSILSPPMSHTPSSIFQNYFCCFNLNPANL